MQTFQLADESGRFYVFGALGLRAGKDIDRTIPAVTRDLGLQGLVRSTASYDIGPSLTRFPTGLLKKIIVSLVLRPAV